MSDSNLTLDIRFDGPPSHESGRFVEAEIDGKSVGIGEWVEDGDDWLLRIPWTPPEEVELLNRRLAEAVNTGEELLARGEKLERQRNAANATVCGLDNLLTACVLGWIHGDDMVEPIQWAARAVGISLGKKPRADDQCGPCDDTCAYPEPGDPDCKASIAGDVKKWTDCADLQEYDARVAEELTRLDTKIDRIRKRVEGIADRLTTVDVEATDEEGNLARQIVALGKRIKRLEPSGPDCKHPRAADDKNAREHLAIKTTIGTIADALADLIKVELAKGTVFECERVLLSNALESVLRARAFLPKPAGRLSSESIPEQVEE